MLSNTITPEMLAQYQATAQRRWDAEQIELMQRKTRARLTAQRAAAYLKTAFSATQVMLFGSLVHEQWFSRTSDIDLAAWGIQDSEFYRAVAHLQDVSPEFSVDLVAMEHCPPHLREAILAEGVPL
jgi:uncharacterized protein